MLLDIMMTKERAATRGWHPRRRANKSPTMCKQSHSQEYSPVCKKLGANLEIWIDILYLVDSHTFLFEPVPGGVKICKSFMKGALIDMHASFCLRVPRGTMKTICAVCRVGGMPKDWHPEEKDDPTQPRPKDPNAADIPQMEVHETPETTRSDSAANP